MLQRVLLHDRVIQTQIAETIFLVSELLQSVMNLECCLLVLFLGLMRRTVFQMVVIFLVSVSESVHVIQSHSELHVRDKRVVRHLMAVETFITVGHVVDERHIVMGQIVRNVH